MVIKEHHKKEIKKYFAIYMYITICSCFLIYMTIMKPEMYDIRMLIFVLLLLIVASIHTYFHISYENRVISITKIGISIKWNVFVSFDYLWDDIHYVEKKNVILYTRGMPRGHIAIVCSCIPIKNPKIPIDEPFKVYTEWIVFHSRNVFEIRMDDFKEGQLEEFWSYVPERLKK